MKKNLFAFLLVVGVVIDFISIIFICSSIKNLLTIIFPIVGVMLTVISALGLKFSKKTAHSEITAQNNNVQTNIELATENQSAEGKGTVNNGPATQINFIRPKLSKSGKKAVMVILIAMYSLLLIAGVLLVAIPDLSSLISGMGICKEISARAYAITIGSMWIALVPSIGYYFVTISPFELSRKLKTIIAVQTTVLLVALNAVFFIVINSVQLLEIIPVKEFYETSDEWFIPVSMVFASLGMMVCYALTLFKIDPEKIKEIKHEMQGDGIFELLKHWVICLIGFVAKLLKGILAFKEKQVDIFVLIASLLLTWLVFFTAFVFAIIFITLFVLVILMYMAGLVKWAYIPEHRETIDINDGGVHKTLTLNAYGNGSRYESVYEDYIGNQWYSSDGGKTVYQKDDNGEKDDSTIRERW